MEENYWLFNVLGHALFWTCLLAIVVLAIASGLHSLSQIGGFLISAGRFIICLLSPVTALYNRMRGKKVAVKAPCHGVPSNSSSRSWRSLPLHRGKRGARTEAGSTPEV